MADEGESTTWSFGGRWRSQPFSGQMRRRKRWKRPGFCFLGGLRPFCGGLEAWDGRRWEIRGERGSGLYYDVNSSTVHWCSWCLWAVGSLMKWSCGDWFDLQVDRTVRMSRCVIWCGAVHRKLGTPGDVAQRDQSLDYCKGWDVFRF